VFESIVSMIFAYGGMVVFGVPTYLLLRSRNIAALWVALAAGFAYGALTMQVFLVLLGLSLGASIQESVAGLPKLIRHPEQWPVGFMLPGVLGGMVSLTFWLIARPDRAQEVSVDRAK
jgi:hypothetical protein